MPYSDEWAEAVREAVGNRTTRQLARPVNVSHGYVAEMLAGRVPSREIVLRMADATAPPGAGPEERAAHTNQLLRAARYDPVAHTSSTDGWSPVHAFTQEARDLARTHRQPLLIYPEEWPTEQSTPEDVRRALEAIRRRLPPEAGES